MTQTTVEDWLDMSELLDEIKTVVMKHKKERINNSGFHTVFRIDEWRDGPVLHIYTTPMKRSEEHTSDQSR